MVKDILSQPHGGIFEVLIQRVMQLGSIKYEQLLDEMSNTPEGRSDVRRYLETLENLRIIQRSKDIITLGNCPALSLWNQTEETFSLHFKVELLSKIVQSEEVEIHYFAEFLRLFFNQRHIEASNFESVLEEYLRKSKKIAGIRVTDDEALSGIKDFVQQFLRYFKFIQKTSDVVIITIPSEILNLIIQMQLTDCGKEFTGIYSELLPGIDRRYLPIFTKSKGDELLLSFQVRFNDRSVLQSFEFVNTPDGGKELMFGNTAYNQIRWVG
jgi:hypothetical protein